MTNGKRTAEDAELDAVTKNDNVPARGGREMQGDGRDGTAHSIDSDEEDCVANEKKYEILQDDDIEGQEDDTIENDVSHNLSDNMCTMSAISSYNSQQIFMKFSYPESPCNSEGLD